MRFASTCFAFIRVTPPIGRPSTPFREFYYPPWLLWPSTHQCTSPIWSILGFALRKKPHSVQKRKNLVLSFGFFPTPSPAHSPKTKPILPTPLPLFFVWLVCEEVALEDEKEKIGSFLSLSFVFWFFWWGVCEEEEEKERYPFPLSFLVIFFFWKN